MAESLFDSSRLFNVLKEQDLLPTRTKEEAISGNYAYYPSFNTLYAPDIRSTLTHEMTHAVDTNILQATASMLGGKKERTNQEQQFLDAYNKLNGQTHGIKKSDGNQRKPLKKNQEDFVQSMYYDKLPEGYETTAYDKYRTSYQELQGWGVGNTSVKGIGDYGTPSSVKHLDPTITAEFDILLSMYDTLPKEVKEASVAARKDSIKFIEKHKRKWKENAEEGYKFENMMADPFANPLLK
jgi:hypothetical protein